MEMIVLVWTFVTGIAVVVLVFVGWAILNGISQQLGLLGDIAQSLRTMTGDLDQARMSDTLWQAVDRVAQDRGGAA